METSKLQIIDWKRLDYGQALTRQKALVQQRLKEDAPDRLVLVEHSPVITIGKSGGAQDLHLSREALQKRGVAVYPIDRGGQATYHGPGQMVAYPIIKLKGKDLHWYVNTMLGSVSDVLTTYGIQSTQKEGQPGVWVGGKKIAFIGVSVRKWITYHGISLNVNNDLAAFSWIVPCGHPDEQITSMQEQVDREVDFEQVKNRFIHRFCRRFGYSAGNHRPHPRWLQSTAPKTEAFETMAMV